METNQKRCSFALQEPDACHGYHVLAAWDMAFAINQVRAHCYTLKKLTLVVLLPPYSEMYLEAHASYRESAEGNATSVLGMFTPDDVYIKLSMGFKLRYISQYGFWQVK